MKKIVFLVVLVLLLASCNVFEGLIPSWDPIVGTWSITKLLMPVGMGGDNTWHAATDYSTSGTVTFKGDNTVSASVTMSSTTSTSAGTWQNDSGVYTVVMTSGNEGVSIFTLSSDNKTAYVSVNNGMSEELTKQ